MVHSATAVVERNRVWRGEVTSEPYEAGWATEALWFLRILKAEGAGELHLKTQISPDGMSWVDEGSAFSAIRAGAPLSVSYCRVSHFGNWLRVVGTATETATFTVILSLHLKE